MGEPPVNPMVDAMGTIMDTLRIMAEAIDGYRKQCEERGYSPTASEQMALQLHAGMIQKMFVS